MFKIIKKVLLSCLSVLAISLFTWGTFILNPSLSYANKTEFDVVTIYHNEALPENTESVINNAVSLIKQSPLFDDEFSIDLCLNDDKIYPNIHPVIGGPLAFATLDKTIIKNCDIDFDNNNAVSIWAINEYEVRNWNLTKLLAHEFTHNLQFYRERNYVIKSTLGKINWKLEGHAEYVSRSFKDDGKLKEKLKYYLAEEKKEHIGIPVLVDEEGKKQVFTYLKYAIVVQYLMDIKGMDFSQVCEHKGEFDDLFDEVVAWSKIKADLLD